MSDLAVQAEEYLVKRGCNSISDDENKLREDSDDPTDPYQEPLEISDKLNSFVRQLPTVRDQLNKRIKATRKNTILVLCSIAVSVVSAVFAGLSFYFSSR